MKIKLLLILPVIAFLFALSFQITYAQGVTTGSITGIITDKTNNNPLPGANVIAVHVPSGTQYGAASRDNGQFNLLNMKIGGPYTVTVTYVGYTKEVKDNVYLNLGQELRLDFALSEEAVVGEEVTVTAEKDVVFNSNRTGAETFVDPKAVTLLPTIKRSTRDLTRLDPRSDDNFSFGGRNWLFNNISLDGSYFNNSFGLDDPAPGGQTNSEPVPFDAVEQVQVSVAPYDIREGGFTGAGINTVTKSGTNQLKGSLYSFTRNESLVGNQVSGQDVVANPDLKYNQSGFSVGGPIVKNALFFFFNAELERRQDPGSNFIANPGGASGLGVSRVDAQIMDSIRNVMKNVYGYDGGAYENYAHNTDNEKLILKLDWNINDYNNVSIRYNRLDARRDLPPHPFVLSDGGRGPNETSLPFENSGYRINNRLNSFAIELNSRGNNFSNRFFTGYNRFRDYREAFSEPFPTIQIDQNGINYTTIGHEPFSIHNILDQDVWQATDNFSYYLGKHVLTVGSTFEYYSFFNSFNLFRYGLFMVPYQFGGTTFGSLDDFFLHTNPADTANFIDFRNQFVNPVANAPYKGENIEVGQVAFYGQDEFLVSNVFSLTYGLRVDLPFYITDPVDNPFSRGLTLLDQDDNPETVDQSKLPGVEPLFSPRAGFNWDISGDRTTQIRGGTGIFTGRLPFVWIGNVISNPGNNPNLYPNVPEKIVTKDDAILQTSFDLNAMVPDFKWPQIWTSNLAVDHKLPWDLFGTLELIYGKDINSIYVRNADLVKPVRYLPDGRPYFGGAGNNELNPDGAGAYVIDNSDEGYNYSATAQLRKLFDFGLSTFFSYTYMEAKNLMKSTEIASVLWAENPVKGDPNKPDLGYSEFGNRHRFVLGGTYRLEWSEAWATSFGLFVEAAEGNSFVGAGGNRYSFIYAGDVNGDGSGTNDLIYIPKDQNDINLVDYQDVSGNTITAGQQWTALNNFIEQDAYLKAHRGEIADRFGDINPWFSNIDLRLLQDFAFFLSGSKHTFQLSIDILNVANLLNSDWGVRQVASSKATSPLELAGFDSETGAPEFKFNMVNKTFTDDPGIKSRYQIQIGLRYLFN